jgi:lysophospholipase L1-like esterase
MITIRSTVLLLALLLAANGAAPAQSLRGIGILGDSYSDEYQFYPPYRSTARNWVEILATTRRLEFGSVDAEGRGEPRNQGHAFNWARSGATTRDLIRTGQHTGLAAQVARGDVTIVVILIGGNDFINALKSPDPVSTLRTVLPQAVANYRTAVRTILAASPRVKVVLATLPDIRYLPEFDAPFRAGQLSAALADACTGAIERFNAQIRSFAANDPQIALIDLDLTTRAANLLSRDYILIAGRRLDRRRPGHSLDCLFLPDGRHPGTLGQGLFACMFIEVVNAKFAAGIKPLEPRELLALARSVALPLDADIALVSPTEAARPVSPAKPDSGRSKAGPSDKASGRTRPRMPVRVFEGHTP